MYFRAHFGHRNDFTTKKATQIMSLRSEIKQREVLPADELQSFILKAVRDRGTDCEGLIGVFVGRQAVRKRGEPNWTLTGVQYGRAERTKCDLLLSEVVAKLQQRYLLKD